MTLENFWQKFSKFFPRVNFVWQKNFFYNSSRDTVLRTLWQNLAKFFRSDPLWSPPLKSPKITTLASLFSVPGWVGEFLLLVLGFGDPTKGMTKIWDHFVILDVCKCVILRPQIMLKSSACLGSAQLSSAQLGSAWLNLARFGLAQLSLAYLGLALSIKW